MCIDVYHLGEMTALKMCSKSSKKFAVARREYSGLKTTRPCFIIFLKKLHSLIIFKEHYRTWEKGGRNNINYDEKSKNKIETRQFRVISNDGI